MNMVAVIGNVATKPEIKETDGGRKVCSFRIGVTRSSGQGADFFTVNAWERQAEVAHQYLSVGRRVGIEGRLRHSTWTNKEDGSPRSRVELVAHRVELLGGPRSAEREARRDEDHDEPASEEHGFGPADADAAPDVGIPAPVGVG